MKQTLLTGALVLAILTTSAQNSFYRNILGDRMPYANTAPIISKLDTVSDGGYMISASARPNAHYVAYVKFDSAFNTIWTKTYATSQSASLSNAAELDDHGYVGVFVDSAQTYFLKTDNLGNVLFCKYYTLGATGILSTGNVCRSAENDSGFVAVFGACAMDYGLAKFDKDGNTEWVADYSAPGSLGSNVYDIHPAFGSGYISMGQEIDQTTQQRSGIVIHSGNQGQILNSKRIQIDSSAGIHTGVRHITWSKEDTCYYVIAYTFDGVPFAVDNHYYVMKLDTALNVMNSWRINPPNTNTALFVNNMVVAPDGNVVINGIMQDTTSSSYKFYMLKFDPSNATMDWCKTVTAISSPQWYFVSGAINGIDFYGPNNDIVFPVFAANDGNSLASIQLDGNGLCIAKDTLLTCSSFSQWICRDFPVNTNQTSFITHTRSLSTLDVSYNDSLLCGNWTSLPEVHQSQNALISISGFSNNFSVQSATNKTLHIEVYSTSGQVISTYLLAPSERYDMYLPTVGVYVVRAYNADESFVQRVINY